MAFEGGGGGQVPPRPVGRLEVENNKKNDMRCRKENFGYPRHDSRRIEMYKQITAHGPSVSTFSMKIWKCFN